MTAKQSGEVIDIGSRHTGLLSYGDEAVAQGADFVHSILEALPAAIYTTDATGCITYYNKAAAELWGHKPEIGTSEWCGSWKLFWPDGSLLPHDQCPMALALKQKQPIRGMEAIAERPDGTRIPFAAYPTPLFDPSGRLIGAVNMLVDSRERKQQVDTAQRLAAIVESADDAIIGKELDGTIITWNAAAERLFGYLAEEIVGQSIRTLIPHNLQNEEDLIIERLRKGQRIDNYETVRQGKHGGLIDVSLTVSPIRDEQGKIVGASTIVRNISERKRAENQIALLAREAEHRTKNLLATVQAAVRLTQADSPGVFKKIIEGRIQALANFHRLFSASRWSGAELHTLISQELSPYCLKQEKRVVVKGPNVLLKPSVAETMAVVLHELSTNSAKYGALSAAEGSVSVELSCPSGGPLTLRWTEANGPEVKQPTRQGFGTRVIKSLVGAQPNGKIRFDWRPEGLRCEITLGT
jgi:PAS domain S-box-containing protein